MSLEVVVGSEDTRADGGNGPLARLQAEHARQLAALTEAQRREREELMRSQGLAHRRDAREDDAVAAQLSVAASHLSLTRMAADGCASNPPQAGGHAAELRAPSLRGDLDQDRAPLSGASAAAEAFRSGPNSDPWLADEPSYAQRPAVRSFRGGHTSHQGQLMPPPPDAQPRSWVGEHGERGERWAQGGDALAFEQQSHGLSGGGFVGRHAAPWSIAAAPMRDARVRARPTTSFRLFVGKLSPTISKAALRSHFVNVLYMRGHFNPDGAIVDIYLPQGLPSHPRGFAFVSFADQASLEQVVSCEGGHIIEGHPCVFDIAAPRGVRVNTNNSLVRHRARAAASAHPCLPRARAHTSTGASVRDDRPLPHKVTCRACTPIPHSTPPLAPLSFSCRGSWMMGSFQRLSARLSTHMRRPRVASTARACMVRELPLMCQPESMTGAGIAATWLRLSMPTVLPTVPQMRGASLLRRVLRSAHPHASSMQLTAVIQAWRAIQLAMLPARLPISSRRIRH